MIAVNGCRPVLTTRHQERTGDEPEADIGAKGGKKMKRVATTLLIHFSVLLVLVTISPYRSKAEILGLEFKGERLSANLNRVPLRTVLEKISKEKGFWFDAISASLEKKVSVQFAGVSLEKALKRILAGTNHSLVFHDGEVVGAMIVGKRGSGRRMVRPRHVEMEEAVFSHEADELADFLESFDEFNEIEPRSSRYMPMEEAEAYDLDSPEMFPSDVDPDSTIQGDVSMANLVNNEDDSLDVYEYELEEL